METSQNSSIPKNGSVTSEHYYDTSPNVSRSTIHTNDDSSTTVEEDESEEVIKTPKKIRVPTTSKLAEQVVDPQKRYHLMSVLPIEFKRWVDSEHDLPLINQCPLSTVYPLLAQMLDCPDYVVNLCTYWYLDIIAGSVDNAQREAGMEERDQKLLISWFGHLFKLFLEKGWSREEILINTQDEIIALGYNLTNISWAVPAQQQTQNYLITGETNFLNAKEPEPQSRSLTMAYITSLIYDVFANPFQFYLIQNIFFKPTDITDAKMPHKINFPKPYKPVAETPKVIKTKKDEKKPAKGGQKSKESISDQKSFAEDADAYILPLSEAVSKEFFNTIFNKDSVNKEVNNIK